MSRRRVRIIIGSLSLAVLWMLIAPLLASLLVVQEPVDKADAIVVLSGSDAFIERVRETANIYRRGAAPKIIMSDDGVEGPWDQTLQRNPRTVERQRWELIGLGVPAEAIEVLPGIVESTHDEAVAVIRAAKNRNFKTLLLVTSAYHSRRALWTARQAAQQQNPDLIIGMQSPPERPRRFWWGTAYGWSTVGREWIKTIYYRFRY